MQTFAVVLAAGQGTRMKSKLYKVLHAVCGKPMVGHVIDVLNDMEVSRKVVVVGHGAEAVRSYLGDQVEYAIQQQQLGTGHAVLQAESLLQDEDGTTFVICGDTPLIRQQSLAQMLELHQRQGAAATILTAALDEPFGYGRIIRGAQGDVLRIVEQKDCTQEESLVNEINTGTYCFDNRKLFAALKQIKNENAQQEYYLTDIISILKSQGEVVEASLLADPAEATGVNDRVALAEVTTIMRQRIVHQHMKQGVTFIDAASTYIDTDVQIGADTIIYPGTILRGKTVIGEDCIIGPNSDITDSSIQNGVTLKQSVVVEANIASHASVGPFAYLRPGSNIGEHVKIGDFVEIKNATLGEGSKVSHLSYVGDAVIGRNVNFGCGAITVNYDGYAKHLTEIGDDAFVGSNVNLIAPVKIGEGAYVVAGSTITNEVPASDLAIARNRQTNKQGYALKIRERMQARKEKKKQLEEQQRQQLEQE